MECKSLRIGNYVKHSNIAEPICITGITPDGKVTFKMPFDNNLDCTSDIDNISGIILNYDIINKCVFSKNVSSILMFKNNGDIIIRGYEADYNGLYLGRVNELHRLQNIVHALYEEELEVNL